MKNKFIPAMPFRAFLSASIFFILFSGSTTFATSVSNALSDQTLSKNTSWTVSNGPYSIQGNIDIPKGITLSIQQGSTLSFDGGHISVEGNLTIGGSTGLDATTTILNTGNGPSIYSAGGNLILNTVDVSGGDKFLQAYNSSFVDIESSSFHDASGSGDYMQIYGGSSVSIQGSAFKGIHTDQLLEMYTNPKLTVTSSNFSDAGMTDTIEIYNGSNETSNSTIDTSTFIQNSGIPIVTYNSIPLSLSNSTLKNNKSTAVALYTNGEINISDSSVVGNNIGIESYSASTTISETNIENNMGGGVVAYGGNVNASNVWWNDTSGPHSDLNPQSKGDSVTSVVQTQPWATSEFNFNKTTSVCCSSVLFIPGIETSRLYDNQKIFNQLWEPDHNGDVEKLYLDSNGKSVDNSIYTKDVIDRTDVAAGAPLVDVDVYKSFMNLLSNLKSSNAINEWQPLAYDWRLGIDSLFTDGIKNSSTSTASSNEKILDVIRDMAGRSKTKKVTIVAHSNGGLVAKDIITQLEKTKEDGLVDKLVMVGVPEFGTPESVVGLLHGDDQEIAGGKILSKTVARTFGDNMETSYGLLPSAKFFSPGNIATSVISFIEPQGSKELGPLAKKYGSAINTYSGLQKFLLNMGADRNTSDSNRSVDVPAILNSNLFNQANVDHTLLDTWNIPTSLQVTSIVGLGIKTLMGLVYDDNGKTDHPERSPVFSYRGDGTVYAGNASLQSGMIIPIDLGGINTASSTNFSHMDMLEALPIQSIISNLLNGSITGSSSIGIAGNPFTFGDVYSSPTASITPSYSFEIHSPVSILVTDANGKQTGVIPNTDQNSDYDYYVEQIPNSKYVSIGEEKEVLMDGIPASATLQGTDIGTFTLDITRTVGSSSTKVTYSDIPVTPMTSVTVSNLAQNIPFSTSTVVTSSSVNIMPQLMIDRDGDGITDTIISADGVADSNQATSTKDILIDIKSRFSQHLSTAYLRDHYIERVAGLQTLFNSKDKNFANTLDDILEDIKERLKVLSQSSKAVQQSKYKLEIQDKTLLYEQFMRLKQSLSV